MARTFAVLPLVLVLLLTACASWTPGSDEEGEPTPESRRITMEEIEAWGVRTAWEAVRRTSHLSVGETREGQPARLNLRGKSSIALDDSPIVVVDGIVRVHFRVLDEIHADRVRLIEILNGREATTRYGTGSAGGAIVVTTLSR
jgi:outer membrane cobalamin receptor